MSSKTPRIDAWCELAMNASVSAVLDLAKEFEIEVHQLEEELIASKNHCKANKELVDACAREIIALRAENQQLKENNLNESIR